MFSYFQNIHCTAYKIFCINLGDYKQMSPIYVVVNRVVDKRMILCGNKYIWITIDNAMTTIVAEAEDGNQVTDTGVDNW